MIRWLLALLLAALLGAAHAGETTFANLPREAQDTLRLIARNGPFPHKRDGSTFGNYEKQLPLQPRGHYREYTVATPGARNRGARRIVCGGTQPWPAAACYYTTDHYRSFRRIGE
ncbi:MAG: ribonuclease domain-containing protein [Sulfurisoma sp.]|nr:ribonuclease domain-containing protein [Sulfurisoma sp.]